MGSISPQGKGEKGKGTPPSIAPCRMKGGFGLIPFSFTGEGEKEKGEKGKEVELQLRGKREKEIKGL